MEQRLVDANKFEVVSFQGKSEEFTDGVQWILEQIDSASTVFIIPENPTNGDMIKNMFPSVVIRVVTESQIGISFFANQNEITWIPIEWWDALWKTESEDKE